MSAIVLQDLVTRIKDASARSNELYRSGIDTIKSALLCDKEAGEALIEAKGQLPHGSFIPWIEANCPFSRSHAHRLMSIAANWEKILKGWEENCPTRETFDSPLPSLRAALSLVAAKPKIEETPEPLGKYKVIADHPLYGEVVEAVEELHGGDVVLCETPQGKLPFLRKELAAPNAEIKVIDVEVLQPFEKDKSEELRVAIAQIIEYLPQDLLLEILSQSLKLGNPHLPDSIKQFANKLS